MSDTIPDAIAARAEAARIAEHQAALVSMQKFGEPLEPPDPVVVIDARLHAMVEIYDREWEEFYVEASVAFAASAARLRDARQAMVLLLEAEIPAAEAARMTDPTTPPRYDIKTAHDFLSVPDDRRDICLREFRHWLGMIDDLQTMMHGTPMDLPEAFVWIDDGKHVADIYITGGDQKIHVASGVMKGFSNDD